MLVVYEVHQLKIIVYAIGEEEEVSNFYSHISTNLDLTEHDKKDCWQIDQSDMEDLLKYLFSYVEEEHKMFPYTIIRKTMSASIVTDKNKGIFYLIFPYDPERNIYSRLVKYGYEGENENAIPLKYLNEVQCLLTKLDFDHDLIDVNDPCLDA